MTKCHIVRFLWNISHEFCTWTHPKNWTNALGHMWNVANGNDLRIGSQHVMHFIFTRFHRRTFVVCQFVSALWSYTCILWLQVKAALIEKFYIRTSHLCKRCWSLGNKSKRFKKSSKAFKINIRHYKIVIIHSGIKIGRLKSIQQLIEEIKRKRPCLRIFSSTLKRKIPMTQKRTMLGDFLKFEFIYETPMTHEETMFGFFFRSNRRITVQRATRGRYSGSCLFCAVYRTFALNESMTNGER